MNTATNPRGDSASPLEILGFILCAALFLLMAGMIGMATHAGEAPSLQPLPKPVPTGTPTMKWPGADGRLHITFTKWDHTGSRDIVPDAEDNDTTP